MADWLRLRLRVSLKLRLGLALGLGLGLGLWQRSAHSTNPSSLLPALNSQLIQFPMTRCCNFYLPFVYYASEVLLRFCIMPEAFSVPFFCFVFCCCPALERENLIFLFISYGRRSSARWEVGCLVPRVGAGTFRLWLEFYCTLMRDRRHLQISWFYLKKVAPTLKQMAYKLCRKANGKTRCAAEILRAFQDEIFGQWLPSGLPRVGGIRNSIALLSFLMICIPCNHILVTKCCVRVVQIYVKSSRRHHLDIKT